MDFGYFTTEIQHVGECGRKLVIKSKIQSFGGARQDVSLSDIDLLSGQDCPMKIDFEIFLVHFWGKNDDFFRFSQNVPQIQFFGVLSFSEPPRAPNDRFPAIYHHSDHYGAIYRKVKKRIFLRFFRKIAFCAIPSHAKIT